MKLRCAVLDDYQKVASRMADWSVLEDRMKIRYFHEYMEEDQVAEAVADCEVIVIMRERTPFRASLLQKLPKLKLLVTTGMRNRSVDLEAARELGVTVCGTSGGVEPTVEHTWALLLSLARHIVPENENLRNNGPWQSTLGSGLYGRTLGLLGLGRIGAKVAQVALAFGMNVIAWSQNLTAERAEEVGVRLAPSKHALLAESDYVSIHLVLSERTKGLIGAAELRKMKKTAYLINTSRGPIVDEGALAEALREGWIAGAAVDVYSREPLPPDDPFRRLPRLLATPHIGYVTDDNYRIYYGEAIENIEAFLQGNPIRVLN